MAHRMACERSDSPLIISVSGMTWSDPSNCNPTEPVPVLYTAPSIPSSFMAANSGSRCLSQRPGNLRNLGQPQWLLCHTDNPCESESDLPPVWKQKCCARGTTAVGKERWSCGR